ncbi:MAG: addiction module toxin RelE [Bacteroidales bacterium]|nr:addiction module toxin RelE [Bacteroidales bacterium]
MNYRIILNNSFLKEVKRLAKKYYSFKEDLEALQNELKINPYSGVDLGNGLRKVRMAIKSKGRGKSHGARIITYILLISENESEINLLTIYDKAERENISREEIEEITKTIHLREI